MSRGVGEFEFLQGAIPEVLAVFIALITQLGDVWFLVLLLSVLYWSKPTLQDDIVSVVGIYLAGTGALLGLKDVFSLPRPDEPLLDPTLLPNLVRPLYELTATASGYGFPSGHATGATLVYIGLACILPIWTFHKRLAAAGTLVIVIGASRVILGVHYVVDIFAGIAVGLVFLVIGFWLLDTVSTDRGTAVFALAIAAAAANLAIRGVAIEPVVLLGATLGLFGAWQLIMLARVLVVVTRPSDALVPIAARGGLILLTIGPLVAAIDWFPLLSGSPYAFGGIVGLASAGALIVPMARYSSRVRRVMTAISFYIRAGAVQLRPVLSRSWWQGAVDTLRGFVAAIRRR